MEELCEYKMMLFARRTCGYSPFYKGFYGRVGTYMTPNLFWFRGVGIEESLKGVVMNKETFDYVAERADALADSEFSTQVTKDAAQAWRDAVAADSSDAAIDAATNDLLDVLEGRPTTIDGVIAFLQGPAIEMLGEDAAASALAAQQQRKEAGAKYCDCEACFAATEILAKFDRIEL